MNAPASPRAPVVLLVEDNPDERELTLAAIRELAGEVVLARHGAEALDYLLGRGPWAAAPPALPALVLLDLKLPLVDGIQVLERLRRTPRTAGARVVVLTSSDEERDQAACRRLGVVDYVRKEIDFDLFRLLVRERWPFWLGGGGSGAAAGGRAHP